MPDYPQREVHMKPRGLGRGVDKCSTGCGRSAHAPGAKLQVADEPFWTFPPGVSNQGSSWRSTFRWSFRVMEVSYLDGLSRHKYT